METDKELYDRHMRMYPVRCEKNKIEAPRLSPGWVDWQWIAEEMHNIPNPIGSYLERPLADCTLRNLANGLCEHWRCDPTSARVHTALMQALAPTLLADPLNTVADGLVALGHAKTIPAVDIESDYGTDYLYNIRFYSDSGECCGYKVGRTGDPDLHAKRYVNMPAGYGFDILDMWEFPDMPTCRAMEAAIIRESKQYQMYVGMRKTIPEGSHLQYMDQSPLHGSVEGCTEQRSASVTAQGVIRDTLYARLEALPRIVRDGQPVPLSQRNPPTVPVQYVPSGRTYPETAERKASLEAKRAKSRKRLAKRAEQERLAADALDAFVL